MIDGFAWGRDGVTDKMSLTNSKVIKRMGGGGDGASAAAEAAAKAEKSS